MKATTIVSDYPGECHPGECHPGECQRGDPLGGDRAGPLNGRRSEHGNGSRRAGVRWRNALAAVSIIAPGAFVAGCTSEPAAAPQTCKEIVHAAAYEVEIADEVKGLDNAIERCGSYDELKTTMEQDYDRIVGYDVGEFLRKRCEDESEALGDSAVCQVAVPETTIPEPEDLSYTGATLDGKIITVTPDEVPFEGKVPAPIARTVELGQLGGGKACVSVLGARDDYALFVNNTRDGDIASMYAKHAQNVADWLRCVSDPVVIPTTAPLGSVPPGATVPATTAAP